MRINYVSKHSWDHVDSDYESYVEIDRKGLEFIGNKHTQVRPTQL